MAVAACESVDPFSGLATAERYDPRAGRFEVVGRLHAERVAHTATRMADGRVLIVGGESSPRSAEVYDPATRSFTLVPAAEGQEDAGADCTGIECFREVGPAPTCRPGKTDRPRGCLVPVPEA